MKDTSGIFLLETIFIKLLIFPYKILLKTRMISFLHILPSFKLSHLPSICVASRRP